MQKKNHTSKLHDLIKHISINYHDLCHCKGFKIGSMVMHFNFVSPVFFNLQLYIVLVEIS